MPQRTGDSAAPAPRPAPGPNSGTVPGPGAEQHNPASFPPERVAGGPVLLQRVQAGDALGIARAVRTSLEHLRPWMAWATPGAATRQAQLARAAEADELWDSGSDFIYSVRPAGEDTIVGQIGLHRRQCDGVIEIGYWIAAGHVRRGFGVAAARAMTPVALGLPGVTRVEIHCDEANAASAAIPRKLGYRLDRIDAHEREAPGERGRRMIWVQEHGSAAQAGEGGAR